MNLLLTERALKLKKIKAIAVVTIAVISMGNESCEKEQVQDQARQLRRRVQMGAIKAPAITLPQGGQFDFQYVANAQLYHVLTQTQAFSTATIDPAKVYDPSGLSQEEAEVFNQCEDPDDIQNIQGVYQKSTLSQKAACMIDLPQGIVAGNIIDFTLKNKMGLSLGLKGIPFLSGASFDFQSYELSMSMRVSHPLQKGGMQVGDRKTIATTSQEKVSNDFGFGLNLNFNGFELGPSYYYKSPLRKVVEDGLVSSINDLNRQWNKAEPWYAMVLRSCDKYIYINAGNSTDAGLKEGDLLKVQNVSYHWSGKACGSELMGAVDYVGGPVGYAKVVSVGDNISAAIILDRDPNYPYSRDQVIKPGARVYVEKLVEPVKPIVKEDNNSDQQEDKSDEDTSGDSWPVPGE